MESAFAAKKRTFYETNELAMRVWRDLQRGYTKARIAEIYEVAPSYITELTRRAERIIDALGPREEAVAILHSHFETVEQIKLDIEKFRETLDAKYGQSASGLASLYRELREVREALFRGAILLEGILERDAQGSNLEGEDLAARDLIRDIEAATGRKALRPASDSN